MIEFRLKGRCSRNYIIMRPVSFDPRTLRKHLLQHRIATLPELKQVLGRVPMLRSFANFARLATSPAIPTAGVTTRLKRFRVSMTMVCGRIRPCGSTARFARIYR